MSASEKWNFWVNQSGLVALFSKKKVWGCGHVPGDAWWWLRVRNAGLEEGLITYPIEVGLHTQ